MTLFRGGGASLAPLVAQTAFGHQKLAPSAPKVLPMIEKSTKNDTKERPGCEKELRKSSFFGTWPGGLREALTIRVYDAMIVVCMFFPETYKLCSKNTCHKDWCCALAFINLCMNYSSSVSQEESDSTVERGRSSCTMTFALSLLMP